VQAQLVAAEIIERLVLPRKKRARTLQLVST
jgi:hypothetical protein